MSHVVMPLDVVKIDGGGDTGLLVEVAEVTVQVWIIDDAAQVTLEVPKIHGIEANQGAKQAPIRLDDPPSEQKPLICQSCVELIQRGEKCAHRPFISKLRRGEAGVIKPIVDPLINESAQLGLFMTNFSWKKIH